MRTHMEHSEVLVIGNIMEDDVTGCRRTAVSLALHSLASLRHVFSVS